MKSIRVTVNHDADQVSILIITEHKSSLIEFESKDSINVREILRQLLDSIDFHLEESVELAEVIDGQYTTIKKW